MLPCHLRHKDDLRNTTVARQLGKLRCAIMKRLKIHKRILYWTNVAAHSTAFETDIEEIYAFGQTASRRALLMMQGL